MIYESHNLILTFRIFIAIHLLLCFTIHRREAPWKTDERIEMNILVINLDRHPSCVEKIHKLESFFKQPCPPHLHPLPHPPPVKGLSLWCLRHKNDSNNFQCHMLCMRYYTFSASATYKTLHDGSTFWNISYYI